MDSPSPNNQIVVYDAPPAEGEVVAEDVEMSEETDKTENTHKEEREFRCRHCLRKFHNQQALGGHQNAHKKRNATPSASSLTAYHRQLEEFLHRRRFYTSAHPPTTTTTTIVAGYIYNRPWSPRQQAFPVNIRLPEFGPGTSNAFRYASDHVLPGFDPRFRIRQGSTNRAVAAEPAVNLRNVPEVEHDESGLDLSLRLGYE